MDDKIELKKVFWPFDKNRFIVSDADVSFVTSGKFKNKSCIRLKSGGAFYIDNQAIGVFLKAEEYINKEVENRPIKVIIEFSGLTRIYILSNAECSIDPFTIFSWDFYRVKFHTGSYEFLQKDELDRRTIITGHSISSINIEYWDNNIQTLKISDKVELVWCFYNNNREIDCKYIYSKYKVLNIFNSDSKLKETFIEIYNCHNHNTLGLDIESFSKRLSSINGLTLPEKNNSVEFAYNNSTKGKEIYHHI